MSGEEGEGLLHTECVQHSSLCQKGVTARITVALTVTGKSRVKNAGLATKVACARQLDRVKGAVLGHEGM
jgi:hypothetical protein